MSLSPYTQCTWVFYKQHTIIGCKTQLLTNIGKFFKVDSECTHSSHPYTYLQAPVKILSPQSSLVAYQVKDPVVVTAMAQVVVLDWFQPWPWNFHMLHTAPPQKKSYK